MHAFEVSYATNVSTRCCKLALSMVMIGVYIGVATSEIRNGSYVSDEPDSNRAFNMYRGYALLKTRPQTTFQVEQLRQILLHPVRGLNFWLEPTTANRSVDIMVSPEVRDSFTRNLTNINLSWRIAIGDIGK